MGETTQEGATLTNNAPVEEANVTPTPAEVTDQPAVEETTPDTLPEDAPVVEEAPVEEVADVPAEVAPVEATTADEISNNAPSNVALDNKVEAPAEAVAEVAPADVVTGQPDNREL